MIRPDYELSSILRRNLGILSNIVSNSWQLRTLYALSACRTPALRYHVDKCTNPKCNRLHMSYNSCRNRHCPKCQGHKREEWIRSRESELLNVPYPGKKHRKWPGYFYCKGLPSWRKGLPVKPSRRRVHPALCPAYPSQRFYPDTALWDIEQFAETGYTPYFTGRPRPG